MQGNDRPFAPQDVFDDDKHDGPRAKRVSRPSMYFPGDPHPDDVWWFVEGLIQERALNVIAGARGSGKSALALSAVLANGQPLLGRRTAYGFILWLAYEAGDSTIRRLDARNTDVDICVEQRPPNLLSAGAADRLDDIISVAEAGIGCPPDVIVVDALASAMRGGDENSGKDVGTAMGVLLDLIARHGATVILIAHTGKADNGFVRGHSSVEADAASILTITNGKGGIRTLRNTKQRDFAPSPDIKFHLFERDGALDVELIGEGGAEAPRRPRMSADAAAMLEAIEKHEKPVDFVIVRDECAKAFRLGKNGELRSQQAIRTAISTSRTYLKKHGLIDDDGTRVSVSKRKEGVSANAPAIARALVKSVSEVPF